MDSLDIRFVGDLQRLQPQPGDVFVLTVDRDINMEQSDILRRYWEQVMGPEVKLLVLAPGMKLGVVAAVAGMEATS